jgi:hypothetical protein
MSEQCMSTHVPCFPVKPWKSTLVSPLMRRFLIVSAYCEEPVAYCRVADLASAERMGFRRACIVAVGCHEGRAGCTGGYRELRRWWSWFRASRKLRHIRGNSSVAAWPCLKFTGRFRPRPTTSRKYLVNPFSLRARCYRHARYQCDDKTGNEKCSTMDHIASTRCLIPTAPHTRTIEKPHTILLPASRHV